MIKKSGSIFLIVLSLALPFSATALTPEEELKSQIEAKSKELEAVSQQIQQTQGSLNETTAKGKTLKQEVDKIDKNIKTVALGIRQSEILLDKFGLEIKSLSQQIIENEQSINDKKDQIAGIFQSLQARDDDNVLLQLLNNKSLTETFLEFQALSDLNGELLTQLSDIRDLKGRLMDQQNQVVERKNSTAEERVNLQAKKSIAEDEKQTRAQILAVTKNQEKLYQQQLAELEKKQQTISDEIDDIESALRLSYNPSEAPGKRAGVFGYPVDNHKLTQEYGATAFAQRAYKTKFHNGIDFGGPIGTPIYAAADGTVTLASKNGTSAERFQYGKYVLIKHANNLSTLYGHMSRQAVTSGQVVKKGDIIGYMGKTGYATGPHLHFTVYLTASIQLNSIGSAGIVPVGYTLNPADYL